MSKGIILQLRQARRNCERDISNFAQRGHIAASMANEGWSGGYLAALDDVMAALTGWGPYDSRYWPKPDEEKK